MSASLFSCQVLSDSLWPPVLHGRLLPPGSPVHRISQVGILEWVAISFCKESSPPRAQTRISCLAGGFTTEPPGKAPQRQLLTVLWFLRSLFQSRFSSHLAFPPSLLPVLSEERRACVLYKNPHWDEVKQGAVKSLVVVVCFSCRQQILEASIGMRAPGGCLCGFRSRPLISRWEASRCWAVWRIWASDAWSGPLINSTWWDMLRK